jgi:hypothetical protein
MRLSQADIDRPKDDARSAVRVALRAGVTYSKRPIALADRLRADKFREEQAKLWEPKTGSR